MAVVVRRYFAIAWLALLSAGALYMAWGHAAAERNIATFEEINVHRLNVVEPDGKPRVIVASRARAAGLYWGGKEYKHPNRNNGGFWFYNDDGDEVGGLTFGSGREGESYAASSGMTFDQYKQDETVSVEYNDRNGQRNAGLHVWDRPDKSLEPAVLLSDRIARATTDEERARLRQEMTELGKAYGPYGAPERLFAGKRLDDSIVKLADRQGRTRLLLKVDGQGEPSVEFLDEAGKVVRRIDGEMKDLR